MRHVETYMPEGMGIWYLRYTDTGEQVPDRGPFLAHKSALKAMRQINPPSDIVSELAKFDPDPPAEDIKGDPPKVNTIKRIRGSGKHKGTVILAPEPEAEPVKVATSAERHAWIEDAAQWALEVVMKAGGSPTAPIRVTMGWPVLGRKFLGECWHSDASSDGAREIFVSPATSDGASLVSTLVHELCHACLPKEVKHGKLFHDLGAAAGLEGKPTHMSAGQELQALIADWIKERGDYPAGSLDRTSGRKKQSTRMIKCECEACGYVLRTTRKWVAVAVPVCPDESCASYQETMSVDGDAEEE